MSREVTNDNGDGLDPLLGTRKVCAWADCTDRNLRRLIQAGKFPAPDLRLGRSLKWRRSTLERLLAEQSEARR